MKNKIEYEVISSITLLLQVVLGIYVLTFAIASYFEYELFKISEILIGLLMLVIGYNNHKIYKRKYMTVVYLGLGLVIIIFSLF